MTGHQHGSPHDDSAAMAELLDLDAEVLHSCLNEIATWVGSWAPDATRRVLDLGAGTGTGTMALTPLFADADFIAVDGSAELLARLDVKARGAGLSRRVHTVQADLDVPWPPLDPVDVVWTSLFLHHLADPDQALGNVHQLLRPGGVIAVLEMDSSPRFLPDDLGRGRPGLETRAHAALARDQETSMPDLGSDWGPRLTAASFTLLDDRTFTVDPTVPYPPAAGRYARVFLSRLRGALDDRLDADDLAAFDRLLAPDGPDSLLLRGDLQIRGSRRGWLARRD